MPIYEYRCDDCGTSHEVMQKMSDDPLEVCERCGGRLQKVMHPVAIHFKGSGFYTTDYGRGSARQAAREGAGAESDSSSGAEKNGADGAKADKPVKAEDKSKYKGKESKAAT